MIIYYIYIIYIIVLTLASTVPEHQVFIFPIQGTLLFYVTRNGYFAHFRQEGVDPTVSKHS